MYIGKGSNRHRIFKIRLSLNFMLLISKQHAKQHIGFFHPSIFPHILDLILENNYPYIFLFQGNSYFLTIAFSSKVVLGWFTSLGKV